ncbi:MAG: hypothetical protein FWC49_04380 [Proteobacteria bacterium]|nr:hypothetical protein [Pseudomonadota bacterium]
MPQFAFILIGSILAAAVFCLPFLLLMARHHRSVRQRQSKKILAIQHKIDAALADDDPAVQHQFNATLREASLTTGLQRPRLEAMAGIDRNLPEKYRIFAKLADQGMDSVQAAAILGISPVEAGQLLNLSQMAKIGR